MGRNSDPTRSLEELLDGPMLTADDSVDAVADEAEAVVTAPAVEGGDPVVIDEDGAQEAQVEAVQEAATVERALLFARMTTEHADAMFLIKASMGREADGEAEKKGFMAKAGEAIKKGWEKLVQFIQTWLGKIVNFFRSGGLDKKLAFVKQNEGKIKTDVEGVKKIQVPSPADVEKINTTFDLVINAVAGGNTDKLSAHEANLSTLKGEKVALVGALDIAKKLADQNVFGNFKTRGAKALGEAKKGVQAAMKDGNKDDKAFGREVLSGLNKASLILVRGFGWWITIVNGLDKAIKLSIDAGNKAAK